MISPANPLLLQPKTGIMRASIKEMPGGTVNTPGAANLCRRLTMAKSSRAHRDEQVVYFIQGVGGGPIKIGTSKDVRKRLSSLQAGSPVPLRMLCAVEGGVRLEADLHASFDDDRLHGEWFNNSEALVNYLGQVLSASSEYARKPDAVEDITAMAAEDDDGNYLAVEAETARYVRYRLACERRDDAQADVIHWLNQSWMEYAPDLDWHPANHMWKAMLKKHPPELIQQATEITAPKCEAGYVRKNGFHKYMFGVMRKIVAESEGGDE